MTSDNKPGAESDWAAVRAEIQADHHHARMLEVQGILGAGGATLIGFQFHEPRAYQLAGICLVLTTLNLFGTLGLMHQRARYLRTVVEPKHGGGWETWWWPYKPGVSRWHAFWVLGATHAATWLALVALGVWSLLRLPGCH